jgi:colanic acid/amylovoran biosynthesis glycosyltransferase
MPPERRIISYVGTFLRPEMLHVYRQLKSLERYKTCVVTRRQKNTDQFPYRPVIELRKPWYRGANRLLSKIAGGRVELSAAEVRQMLQVRATLPGHLAHIYLGHEALRALPYLQEETIPRIVSFDGSDLSASFTKRHFHELEPHVKFFLCPTESLAAELARRGCPRDRIRLNPRGVPMPASFTRELHNPDGNTPLHLLQATRFIDLKGLDATIQCLAILREGGIPAKLTLAGDGPLRSALRDQCAELGVSEHVDFPGFLNYEDLSALYRRHDIYLHPSRTSAKRGSEGIPNSMLEAMAHGMPTIATRHGGIPEAIEHETDGWLVEKASGRTCAAAVREILRHPGKLAELSSAARAKISRKFSIQKCGRTLERIYDEALAD